MASVVFETPYAFSESGKYFSYCGNDGKLKIWDTSTNVLKQEYTKNLHLSSPCTCLIWLQTSKAKSPKKRKLNASLHSPFDAQDVIVIGTSNGNILVYSVENNTILSEKDGHNDKINDMSLFQTNLYSCSDDKHIIQWDLNKYDIKSKWKIGKERIKSILALSCGKKLVTASCAIKLWDIDTKSVLKSFVGHASPVFKLMEAGGKESYFLSAAKGERIISAWSVHATEEPSSPVVSFLLQDSVASFHVNTLTQTSTLCAVSESGVMHIFEHKLNGSAGKPLKSKLNVTVASDIDSGGKTNIIPLPIHAAVSLGANNVLFAYGSPACFAFESLVLSEQKDENVVLVRQNKKRGVANEFNSRTRVPETQGDVEYVKGGLNISGTALRKQREVPLEQRLENLELVSNTDAPRKDNMAQLLVQGLQSRDKDLIQDVLFRREDSIINSTVRNLPIQALLPLLRELTTLLHGKTFTNKVAVKWLNALVRSHAAILLANPELKLLITPLVSTIESKVENLSGLIRLRGRLGLVVQQITSEPSDDHDHENEPLVSYQEREDSSESEPASESDEGEEWDEFSDMDDDVDPE